MNNSTIVVFGGGLIGQEWSMLFASNKLKVIIFEISPTQIENAKLQISKKLNKFVTENICRSKESAQVQMQRISYTSILEDVPKSVDFVMECVPENLEIKSNVFALLDTFFDKNTVRMSSSSYIPVSRFTGNLINRGKCVIAHPVNPPYFLRLVEIVPAPYTDRSTIDSVKMLMKHIGQEAIELKKEVDGFAVNRIQSAVYNSIFNLIREDIVCVSDVDKLLTEGLAPRWTFYGPMLISALNGPGSHNYFDKYLSSLDSVNCEQGYPPQHNGHTLSRIVEEMKKYDPAMLIKINESRDSYLGQVLNIKNPEKQE